MAEHNDLGKKGEEIAVKYLQEHNYTILDLNWTFQKAEVDIIALKNNTLAVVEVKTRSSIMVGEPQEFINKKKVNLLVKAINEYVITKNLDVNVRFDIITVVKSKSTFKLIHFKDAFYSF